MNKLIEKNNWTSLRHLRGIIGLRKYYADKDIIDAMNSCEMWNRYSYQLILMILKGRCNSPPTLDPSKYHNSKINERIAENKKDLIRNLSYYEKLI